MNIPQVFGTLALAAFGQGLYVGTSSPVDPKWASLSDFADGVPFCRGYYASDREEANGSGWWTDYPGADHNLSVRLGELTKLRARGHVVVRLNDPLINRCPVVYMSDVGTLRFADDEINALRRYLTKGGFLWVDDFWGDQAWDQWVSEIRRVLTWQRLFNIPAGHPIRRALFNVEEIRQQPTVGLWEQECDEAGDHCHGMRTSERGQESVEVHFRGIEDDRGRLMVIMTHNTDVADGWEDTMDVGDGEWAHRYSLEFSADAYALAANIFLYALTH